jgi:hypothetical protein
VPTLLDRNQFLGSLKGLKIRALVSFYKLSANNGFHRILHRRGEQINLNKKYKTIYKSWLTGFIAD